MSNDGRLSGYLALWLLTHGHGHHVTAKRQNIFKDAKLALESRSLTHAQLTNVRQKIMRDAERKLKFLFGINVHENDGVLYLDNTIGRKYPQLNKPPPVKTGKEDATSSEMGLLYIVLSAILMAGGCLRDDQLYKLLRSVGVHVDGAKSAPHSSQMDATRGSGRRRQSVVPASQRHHHLIFKEWSARKRYLTINKISDAANEDGSGTEKFEVTWGDRARVEICPKEVIRFVAQVYKVDVDQFAEQWRQTQPNQSDMETEETVNAADQAAQEGG